MTLIHHSTRSPDTHHPSRRRLSVVLMGVSFSTGNLGVSALADGAISGILESAPHAAVTIMGEGDSTVTFEHDGRTVGVPVQPVGYGKRLWRPNHLIYAYVTGLLARCLPRGRWRSGLMRKNPLLRVLEESDVVGDFSGGDSFSDIYGRKRVILQCVKKSLVFLADKDLVLLPQTIGPFTSRLGRKVARLVLRRSKRIYTRDVEGLDRARELAGDELEGRLFFAPDAGMLVRPREPEDGAFHETLPATDGKRILVGMNVSGLLYTGGYTGSNDFGLKSDYGKLCSEIAGTLLEDDNVSLVLVPHVITSGGWKFEDDLAACEKVRDSLPPTQRERTILLSGDLTVRETKYVIGRCSFFIGSRMHACIAALSQGVPAVGVAYSPKFRGVFETLEVEGNVADPRASSKEEIVEQVMDAFVRRGETAEILRRTAPAAAARAMSVFEDLLRDASDDER